MTATVARQTSKWTPYMSSNTTEANEAWDAIEPGHGVVAIDRTYAADHNLLPSSDHPSDLDKVIYVIEAYHAMHCLVRASPIRPLHLCAILPISFRSKRHCLSLFSI